MDDNGWVVASVLGMGILLFAIVWTILPIAVDRPDAELYCISSEDFSNRTSYNYQKNISPRGNYDDFAPHQRELLDRAIRGNDQRVNDTEENSFYNGSAFFVQKGNTTNWCAFGDTGA